MLEHKIKSISAPSGNNIKLNMDCSSHEVLLSISPFQTTFTLRKLVFSVAKILNIQFCFDFLAIVFFKNNIMISGNTPGKKKQTI